MKIKMDLNFAAIIVTIGSGKNHHWMVNLWRTFNERQDICIILKCLLIDCLLILRKKNSNYTEEKSDNTLIR